MLARTLSRPWHIPSPTPIGVNWRKVNGMSTGYWICLFCFSCFPMFAQQNGQMGQSEPLAPVSATANHSITLDVVVADKGGHAASGLQQPDFTLLDNKAPQKITSFRVVE